MQDYTNEDSPGCQKYAIATRVNNRFCFFLLLSGLLQSLAVCTSCEQAVGLQPLVIHPNCLETRVDEAHTKDCWRERWWCLDGVGGGRAIVAVG